MKRKINRTLLMVGPVFALASFLMIGCSHTVSHTERTRVSSTGRVSSSETTVRENPDGTTTKTETKKSSGP